LPKAWFCAKVFTRNGGRNGMDEQIRCAARLILDSKHMVAFTGAGHSTASGIPDFRSPDSGLWEKDNPMLVASVWAFRLNPKTFYNWIRPMANLLLEARPNVAHEALAELEAMGLLKAIITQNIDDLHQRAGTKEIYEVHGSLRTMTCAYCRKTYPSQQFQGDLAGAGPSTEHTPHDGLPHCPGCARVLKPDITLFGEMLPMETWQQAEAHCLQADVILVVGSSLEVWPAASLPELAVEHDAHLIINNLSPTHLDSRAAVLLPGDVAGILPELFKRIHKAD
jgi:NAD-dependent deacetylase